jgi:hypothetical protein
MLIRQTTSVGPSCIKKRMPSARDVYLSSALVSGIYRMRIATDAHPQPYPYLFYMLT